MQEAWARRHQVQALQPLPPLSNFLSHHLAGIVTATVYADARHIEDGLNDLKMRAHALPASDAAAA